jgi:hypothetical protein
MTDEIMFPSAYAAPVLSKLLLSQLPISGRRDEWMLADWRNPNPGIPPERLHMNVRSRNPRAMQFDAELLAGMQGMANVRPRLWIVI